ncbi:SRPBCC family protein [Nocardia sp. NPDC048505]|uniref:SRPBCC family protein n=1 Tax=unclassified Nocardia TaxID=2637762 RepID=UPI0033D3C666
MAADLPGAVVGTRLIRASFEAVWSVVADLEHATPRYEPGVASVRIIEERGESLRLLVRDSEGREAAMTARLRPGWCVMQSSTVVIAFAGRAVEGGTMLAHLEFRREQPGDATGGSRDPCATLAKIDHELHVIEQLATGSAY